MLGDVEQLTPKLLKIVVVFFVSMDGKQMRFLLPHVWLHCTVALDK